MSVQVSTDVNDARDKLIEDADCNEVAENDVLLAPAVLSEIEIDNSENVASSFVKLYNHRAPVVGTTAPDQVIEVAAGDRDTVALTLDCTIALSFACVTTGGTAGTTGPTENVPVTIKARVPVGFEDAVTGVQYALETEYVSPNQHGGVWGPVYRMYHGAKANAEVIPTVGIDLLIEHCYQRDTTKCGAGLSYDGTNTIEAVVGTDEVVFTVSGMTLDGGWVDYVK